MARTYTVGIPGAPEKFIARARKVAKENKAVVKGDNLRGSVSVIGIRGSYRVEKKKAFLTIEKKPFFIPWRLLEKEVSKFFGKTPLING